MPQHSKHGNTTDDQKILTILHQIRNLFIRFGSHMLFSSFRYCDLLFHPHTPILEFDCSNNYCKALQSKFRSDQFPNAHIVISQLVASKIRTITRNSEDIQIV